MSAGCNQKVSGFYWCRTDWSTDMQTDHLNLYLGVILTRFTKWFWTHCDCLLIRTISNSHRVTHLHLIYRQTDINRNSGWHDKQSIWMTIKFFLLPNRHESMINDVMKLNWKQTESVDWSTGLPNLDRSSCFWFRSICADWFSGKSKPFNISSWPCRDQIMMCKMIESVREMNGLTA